MDNFEKNDNIKQEEDHTVVFPAEEQAPDIMAAASEEPAAEENGSDEPEVLEGTVSDAPGEPELTGFYATLHDMDPKKMKILQIVLGILSGVICWAALRASSLLGEDDGILRWAFIIVFAILMLGSNYLGRKAAVSITKFRLGLIIGLGACIAVFAIVFFASGQQYGLVEMLFPDLIA